MTSPRAGRWFASVALGSAGVLSAVPASAAPVAGPPAPTSPAATDAQVEVRGVTYASMNEYFRAPEFVTHGARCGTEVTAEMLENAARLAPTDCSFSRTVINSEYDVGDITIPVVVHVVSRASGTGNISDELVYSQIDILNEDFNAIAGTLGADGTNMNIRFVLAALDPDGNPTTGINRVVNDGYFADPGSGGFNDMKTALNWDTSTYLNIYTNDAADLLGYATFPSENAGSSQDGVVVLWNAFGRNSSGDPYDLGRTATHEIGHYLGLFHTFQGGCGTGYTSGDLIADTPATAQPTYECAATSSGCGGAAPYTNYMDYSQDRCLTHFTVEQANRIRCSIYNHRASFVQSLPAASYTYDTDGLALTFENLSTFSNPERTTFAWDFGDGTGSNEANPSHKYGAAGAYTVTLRLVSGVLASEVSAVIEVEEGSCSAGGRARGMAPVALAVLAMLGLRRRRRPAARS